VPPASSGLLSQNSTQARRTIGIPEIPQVAAPHYGNLRLSRICDEMNAVTIGTLDENQPATIGKLKETSTESREIRRVVIAPLGECGATVFGEKFNEAHLRLVAVGRLGSTSVARQ
jgi:hypothetical protein